jgi:hypothetical protein
MDAAQPAYTLNAAARRANPPGETRMKPFAFALALSATLASGAALAGDSLVQFNGAIGVDPVAGIAAGAPVPNTVLGVPPGGRPWILRKLRASIDPDGSISAKGSGLLFSGGDLIGTRGGVTQVFATLFCSGVAHHSPIVDLDTAGNFVIKGKLGAVPPSPCLSPVLLIRNAAGTQAWFAAGIPGGDD